VEPGFEVLATGEVADQAGLTRTSALEDPDLGHEVGFGSGDTGTATPRFGTIEAEASETKLRCDRLAEPWACWATDDGFGHASGRRCGWLTFRTTFEGGQEKAWLLADAYLGVGTSLLDVGKRLDDGGLAKDKVLLADGELALDAFAFGCLDPFGGVVDGIDDGVGQTSLAIAQAEDQPGGIDL